MDGFVDVLVEFFGVEFADFLGVVENVDAGAEFAGSEGGMDVGQGGIHPEFLWLVKRSSRFGGDVVGRLGL